MSEEPNPTLDIHVRIDFGTVKWSSKIPKLPYMSSNRVLRVPEPSTKERDVGSIVTNARLIDCSSFHS